MADEAKDQRAPYVQPEGRDFRVRDTADGEPQDVRDYIGVTSEYMTYATVADKPHLTDTERFLHTDQYDHLIGNLDADGDAKTDGGADEVASTGEVEKPETETVLPPLA